MPDAYCDKNLAGREIGMSGTARVSVELRPALDGHFGIPQETRLLFSALAGIPEIELHGWLQTSIRATQGGVPPESTLPVPEQVHRYAQTVVSLKGSVAADWKEGVGNFLAFHAARWRLRLSAWLGLGSVRLRRFETRYFEDFIWQGLFARSVPPQERERVLRCNHWVCPAPWRSMHLAGLERRWFFGRAAYPRMALGDIDVFIAQTPYPGSVSKGTALVVHYHDAIPVLMPHTISDRAFHQASHFHALAANVRDGSWFVCVSEATRQDLLRLFPEAEPRAVTIHNMLPAHYFPSAPEPERVAGIVRRYQHGDFVPPKSQGSNRTPSRTYKLTRRFGNEAEKSAFYEHAFGEKSRFLLMVSTIEPRKNHQRLLEAWEVLRDQMDRNLKLVLVGHIGWDYKSLLDGCEDWIEQGGLFMLHSVPADALRILYRHALVTVCPSVGEGFDFSGVEAMRCGGVVAASDIPVHREVYGMASEYFDPYDTASLVQALRRMIDADDADVRREALRQAGAEQSAAYLPERIVPQWAEFLRRVADEARRARR
ncbi:group 1 glycosyl transferase [Burkholderiales bacterium GJ-E10]|nr:group 1 glycosyl transferase [Burkholderiales bacterium GJ-E10]